MSGDGERTGDDENGRRPSGGDRLAAVVGKERADAAIEALRAEGVYDAGRSIAENDADTLAVPVTDPPAETAVAAVVPGADLERRTPGLDDRLRERGFDESEVAAAPGSWAVVGDVLLADFAGCERAAAVGAALLDLHREADTVLDRRGIEGPHREPDVAVVAGSGDTETVHVEHGTRYALDLRTVMFSPGNKAERVRTGERVETGERVLDMFAGVGYFTLPMARAGARVTAVERNPAAFRYLLENCALNEVTDRVVPVRADCRDAVAARPDERFRRVVMGHYDAHEYLDAALAALEPGGILHFHAATPEGLLPDRPRERVRAAADAAGREVTSAECRRVKTCSEGVWHVVVDATVA